MFSLLRLSLILIMKKIISFIYLIYFWGCTLVQAQLPTSVQIQDVNFFNAILQTGRVKNNAGVAVNCSTCVLNYPNRVLSLQLLHNLNITEIDISNSTISDLSVKLDSFLLPPSNNPIIVQLKKFNCKNNLISVLPNLNDSLTDLDCSNNPIYCLPILPPKLQNLDVSNTFISCLPNYNAYIRSNNQPLPLCNTQGNLACTSMYSSGSSETFPNTEVRKIISGYTLDLPFTTTVADIINFQTVVYEKNPPQKDTLSILGGDVILGTPAQLNTLYTNPSPIKKWEGYVPYDTNYLSDSIRKAIHYFNIRAGIMGVRISFVPKMATDIDYITFVHIPNNYASYVGKIGGNQPIYVDFNGLSGKILHEMTHALGLYHEHQRFIPPPLPPVNININNIRSEFLDVFCPIKMIQVTPYDYNSVMHYACHSFSILPPLDGVNLNNTKNTIEIPPNIPNIEMGQRSDYTFYDILDINQIYPDGIIEVVQAPSNTKTYMFQSFSISPPYTVSWSTAYLEPIWGYNISIQSSTPSLVIVNVPYPNIAPRAARGFIVATVTFANGTQKKYYKYVYRN